MKRYSVRRKSDDTAGGNDITKLKKITMMKIGCSVNFLTTIRDGNRYDDIPADSSAGVVVFGGEWIYYKEWIPPTSDRYETGGANADFYKIKTNGNEKQQLGEFEAKYVSVYNNFIYYADLSDGVKLYRMKKNGEDKMKLTDEQANFINVVDDWIYYAGANDQLCRIRIDGTNREVNLY